MASDGKDKNETPSESDDASAIEELTDEVVSEEDLTDLETLDGAADGDIVDPEESVGAEIDLSETEDLVEDETDSTQDDTPLAEELADEDDGTILGADDEAQAALDAADEDLEQQTASTAEPIATSEPVVIEKRGGFFPMALGGVVAAALGYGAASYPDIPFLSGPSEDPLATSVAELAQAQEGLAASVDGKIADAMAEQAATLRDEFTNTGAQIAQEARAEATSLGESVAAVSASLGTLEERLTNMEKRPIADNVSREAIAAYEREINAMQETVATQRAEFEKLLADAKAVESEAEETEQMTAIRAAVGKIQAAVDAGSPFAAALTELSELTGEAAPTELSEVAETGVPTLSVLQSEFADAARGALSVARAESPDSEGGVGAFFARQFNARSVTARDGDDPDAVLSRVGAAIKGGDLSAALNEVSSLPDSAQSAMADWINTAQSRHGALAAAGALASGFTQD